MSEPHAGEWLATGADSTDHIEIEPAAVKDPVDDATLAFHHITRVFDPATGGQEPGDAVPGPDDFASWLTTHPHLRTTKPKPVEALGLEGVSIDVRVNVSLGTSLPGWKVGFRLWSGSPASAASSSARRTRRRLRCGMRSGLGLTACRRPMGRARGGSRRG